MRKMILLAMLVSVSPAFAYISVSDTYSSDFLKMNGYSDTTINMVVHERNKAAGVPIDTTSNKKIIKNKFLRTLYNAYVYTDPAMEGNQFLNHEIKIEPGTSDL